MNGRDLKKMPEQALVHQFREFALDQESALLDSDTAKYNRLYKKLEAIESELKVRGPEARKALLTLLDDANLRVRYEAARRLLAVNRHAALTALNEVATSHQMPEQAEAQITLSNLEHGIFTPT